MEPLKRASLLTSFQFIKLDIGERVGHSTNSLNQIGPWSLEYGKWGV